MGDTTASSGTSSAGADADDRAAHAARTLVMLPGVATWRSALRAGGERSDEQRAFRAQLGLPTDVPIVMSGHQAEVWHPGILAKFIAMTRAARTFGAAPVWLVVDTDSNDPLSVRFPAWSDAGPRASGGERCSVGARALQVNVWRVGDGPGGKASHVPTGRALAVKPAALPDAAALGAAAGVGPGLEKIRAALLRHAGEPSVARQFARAASDLAGELGARATLVFASDLSRTDGFARLLALMSREPQRAIDSYNRHVRTERGGGLAELSDGELPLWRIEAGMGSQRQRVHAGDLRAGDAGALAPRALLLTGLMRWLGCEMFIHGTGGAGSDGASGYDRVTSRWLGDWLGATLAPAAMVTATLRLSITGAESLPGARDIDRAAWLAHAAAHRPELLDDAAAADRARALVGTLRALHGKRGVADRDLKRTAYRELHALLAGARARNSASMALFKERAAALASQRRAASIAGDRTWAFPLYERPQLDGLANEIAGAFDP